MKIALGVEYDGTHYHGWQNQAGVPTVQHALEAALTQVADHPVSVNCAGRTDAGVHALGQVIHFDTTASRNENAWIGGVNSLLPRDISVQWTKEMDDTFHARFSAVARSYRYVIYNHTIRSALGRYRATWHRDFLDEKRMNEAGKYLLGEHDFSSFRSTACQSKTPMRCVFSLSVWRKNSWVIIDVKANAFLHHMVRNIVGVLMRVGEGKERADWVEEVLNAKSRIAAAMTAPSQGLYLMKVDYPDHYQLPEYQQYGMVILM